MKLSPSYSKVLTIKARGHEMAQVESNVESAPIPIQGPLVHSAPATKGPARVTKVDSRYLGLLQQITRCGNDWRPYLISYQTVPSTNTLSKCVEVFTQVQDHVQSHLDDIKKFLLEDADVLSWWRDVATHIENQWGILKTEVVALEKRKSASGDAAVKELISILDDSGYSAARLTVTVRINDALKTIAVGESINFDTEFQDEIPDVVLRKRFLSELDNQILLVDGYVDVSSNTITRITGTGFRLWRPIIVAVILLPACEFVLYGILKWKGAPGLQPTSSRPSPSVVLGDLGLIWLGMFAHIALSWYKGFRQNGASVVRSMTSLLYLVA